MIRKWRKVEDSLRETLNDQKKIHVPNQSSKQTMIQAKKFRLPGGGRKVNNESLEEALFKWIVDRRDNFKHVSRKSIMAQAKIMSVDFDNGKSFSASMGWCDNFLKRYNLATRQKTHQSQRPPKELVPKVVSFFQFLRTYFAKNDVKKSQLVAMDETPIYLEMSHFKVSHKKRDF